jgi:hypothetical protein
MALRKDSDILKAKLGQENDKTPVFTEEDRAKIRQTLTQFSKKQPTKKTSEEPETKKNPIPNINNQQYHVAFSWKDWPKELDEVPQLFLFRLNIWPFLHHKTPMALETLQSICIASGVTSIALDNRASGYYMSGIFENGGSIRHMYLTLSPLDSKEVVVIDNCTFKTLVE